jgi:hypothetical protein
VGSASTACSIHGPVPLVDAPPTTP